MHLISNVHITAVGMFLPISWHLFSVSPNLYENFTSGYCILFSLITVDPILPNNIMDDSFLVRQIKVAILEKVDQYSIRDSSKT